jgi:hypothetical protein
MRRRLAALPMRALLMAAMPISQLPSLPMTALSMRRQPPALAMPALPMLQFPALPMFWRRSAP